MIWQPVVVGGGGDSGGVVMTIKKSHPVLASTRARVGRDRVCVCDISANKKCVVFISCGDVWKSTYVTFGMLRQPDVGHACVYVDRWDSVCVTWMQVLSF